MKTYSMKAGEIDKRWVLIDAEGLVLGRLAVEIAKILRGKDKPTYTPHMDCGDNVVVINAAKLRVTGNKREDKRFYWHTGWPGGIKSLSIGQILDGRFPERALRKAVQRMVPRGPLGRRQLSNLRVFPGADHLHEAQQPTVLDIAARNTKNNRRSAR